jgi:hypothetical protein
MDGVGPLNEGTEADAPLHVEAGRVLRFRSNAADKYRISWPQYEALEIFTEDHYEAGSPPGILDNFESCELRAAVCCFTDTRDSSAISPNAQVCDIDLGASRHSSRVYSGFGSLDSDAYCVGMAWKEGDDVTNRYKGNMLFDIAYGTFLDEKYTKSIPGAPLCGCVEKMPTITAANCRTVEVTDESYTLTSAADSLTITQDASTNIEYKDCGDLKTHYNTINSDSIDQNKLAARITGTCDADAYLNKQFFVRDASIATDRYAHAAGTASWQQVAGMGLSYYPTKTWGMAVRDTEFRRLIGAGPQYKLVYRHCESCLPSHQHIFYKRLTPLPSGVNFLNYFMNNWVETSNEMSTDFKLYSTLADAQTDNNAWGYCKFDKTDIGFPGECAPGDHYVPCMWNTYETWQCGNSYNGKSHGFYVEN